MADKDDTRPRGRLEQTIESERAKLLQASAVLKCLYEVLLHADGDEAVTYADAAYLARTVIEDSVERLDSVRLRPLINERQAGRDYELPGERPHSGTPGNRVEDVRAVYAN
jgi:hypothetical protein